ncbi:hypothetical protein HNR00_004215 [Methylorubrum rhodinum]|uniref:Uncharacterized protein n=1 Tax=Methylorubrum rhodinum TaxID=29428 RepID=A0A840ZRI6_9HYPH|nr:hypothetical protein [Methylorubrum rhodinum]MBB5759481.1 hypothetical protein [Methylorubrum rhodinum]
MKIVAFIFFGLIGLAACVVIYLSQRAIDCDRFIAGPDEAVALGKQYLLDRSHVYKKHGYSSGSEYISDIEKTSDCCSAYYGKLDLTEYYSGQGWIVSINAARTATRYEHILEFSPCFGPPKYNGGLSGY